MDGILRCSRYSFGPNKLHYCGPDANAEILGYIKAGIKDPGLTAMLKNFQTLFPYLKYIAQSNNIEDPFDEKVVEAYWVGNSLLDNIDKRKFYDHLLDAHQLKKRLGRQGFEQLTDKLKFGAVPHHSFHVLNIWQRTGHVTTGHTLESLDNCRIGWGEVEEINGPVITVKTQPLMYGNGRLYLGEAISKTITRQLETTFEIEQLKVGDMVTIHWNVPCEVITKKQATGLKKYTLRNIALANLTI